MYNRNAIDTLVEFIIANNGKYDKSGLSHIVKERFGLIKDRSVFYNSDFSIRFCHSAKKRFSNVVLSLSVLQKYDKKPFIVCVVTPDENILLLANTTFLAKISHSSHQLRIDNIRGSFLGHDIRRNVERVDNSPQNFEELFLMHESFSFEENLERLVEATNNISPTGKRFDPTSKELDMIMNAPERAIRFLTSEECIDLNNDLNERVKKVQNEIAIAALIDNINIRGRVIEFLITSNGEPLKDMIVDSLLNGKPLPEFKTDDQLGDFIKEYSSYSTATEIKTKVLYLSSNPKAYNIDKLLRFLSKPNSIYMIYLVGISRDGSINVVLCSVFDEQLIKGTAALFHWAGRNSRGVTQFKGDCLTEIINNPKNCINLGKATIFIDMLLSL